MVYSYRIIGDDRFRLSGMIFESMSRAILGLVKKCQKSNANDLNRLSSFGEVSLEETMTEELALA